MSDDEMFVTLNCGVGFVIAVAPEDEDSLKRNLQASEFKNWKLGVVETSKNLESTYRWKGRD